ncbi:LacI family DNA-binding transcriptional regulator [Kitasatospora sp. NPDC091207]|uniref:LacI family DNA-binding transcriptional regulator n=1 Tax=Kitasatospora sp. NPDC091207 TaxID=3364083 RepID=UPI003817AC67
MAIHTNPSTPPTSADVARLAGVSRATVSFVLNDTPGGRVGEQTRQKVRAAAEELGYVPHAAARSLRAGRSAIVLLVGHSWPIGPLFSSFYRELQHALQRHGYTGVLYGRSPDAGDDSARAWAELRPAAVLCLEPVLTPTGVRTLHRAGTRAVVTLGIPPVEGAHNLVLDQSEVGAAAGAHLIATGRRRIGVVVPTDPGLDAFSALRLAGVRAAAAPGGPAAAVHVEPLPLDYTEQSAGELAERCRALALDAVFGYNDEYAMLVQRALQDAGLDVPGQVAVVGADDLMLARLLRPRLTTVHLTLPDGEELAALVDRLVTEPDQAPTTQNLLGVRMVVRDSA